MRNTDMQKKIGIVGVTGFVGKYLAKALAARGYVVVGFSRAGSGTVVGVTEWRSSGPWNLQGLYGLINLAGERVDQRWTESNRRKFFASRVTLSQELAATIQSMSAETSPSVWINASAVGYYGNRGDEELDETSRAGSGYLAGLCVDWERATAGTQARVVLVRIGMVLGRGGMAWDRLRRVFQFGGGARLGNGQQWMPWIHIDDLVGGMIHSLENEAISGVVNGVSPAPERNISFTKKLAHAVKRPALFVAPGFVLRTIFGEFGDFLLGGQRLQPKVWLESGYRFQHPTLESALSELLS